LLTPARSEGRTAAGGRKQNSGPGSSPAELNASDDRVHRSESRTLIGPAWGARCQHRWYRGRATRGRRHPLVGKRRRPPAMAGIRPGSTDDDELHRPERTEAGSGMAYRGCPKKTRTCSRVSSGYLRQRSRGAARSFCALRWCDQDTPDAALHSPASLGGNRSGYGRAEVDRSAMRAAATSEGQCTRTPASLKQLGGKACAPPGCRTPGTGRPICKGRPERGDHKRHRDHAVNEQTAVEPRPNKGEKVFAVARYG